MIDYLKLTVHDFDLIDYIKNKPILELIQTTDYVPHFKDYDTQVKTKEIYDHKGILFCFYIDRLDILFKPHYYWNNNVHNANDFNHKDCTEVLTSFIQEFDLSGHKAKVMQLEYGINFISTGIYTPDKIIGFAQLHDKNKSSSRYPYEKRFQKISFIKGKAIYNTFKIIKLYWKGNQFIDLKSVHPDTIRFEVKSNKTKYINQLGIYYIEDLVNEGIFRRFKEEITKEFSNVLFLDCNTNTSLLTVNEEDKLNKYLRLQFWDDLINQNKYRNGFQRHKKNYFNLLNKAGYNIHTELQKLVNTKTNELLKIGADFNQKTICITSKPNNKKGADFNIIKGENCTTCIITGLDISMQKPDSILLSHTGLWHYYLTDKNTFEEVKTKYLSKKWIGTPIHTQIKEIAHNIRNSKSNSRIKQIRIYPLFQINLLTELSI